MIAEFLISPLLIFLAAAACGTYEVLDRNFFESRFKNLPQAFWYPHRSWKVAPKIFGYRVDAWHLLKSLMVVALICAIIFHRSALSWYWELLIGGGIWNGTFTLFYHVIWTKGVKK